MNKQTEFSEAVAAKLVKLLEDTDPGNWEKPWIALTTVHHNPLSKATYSGINQLMLAFYAMERGYTRPLWATFKQIADAGGRLDGAKGKGVGLMRWNTGSKCERHGTGKYQTVKGECCDERRTWGGWSHFTVFNADHWTGIDLPDPLDGKPEPERFADVEAFVAATGIDIVEAEGDRAFYVEALDRITIPTARQFDTARGRYSTLLHEITHATKHPSRVGREGGKVFGDNAYAYEELVAELGSATLAHHFGIEPEPHIEHAAYLKSWLKALKADPGKLYDAAREASTAVKWLLDKATVSV